MTYLAYLGALGVGIALGLTGAGGSVLTLPVLVYLAGIDPALAVAMSLPIVGASAISGMIVRLKAGEIHWRAVGLFSISGMLGAALGSRFTSYLPSSLLMTLFALIMFMVALQLWLSVEKEIQPAENCRPVICLLTGCTVGFITGLIGVGGGFLLVPALTKFARLPIRIATGTSLAIVASNSVFGFISHFQHSTIDLPLTALFAGIAIIGGILGSRFANRLPQKTLRRCFASLITFVALLIIWQQLQ